MAIMRKTVETKVVIHVENTFCSYACQFYEYYGYDTPHCTLPVLCGRLSVELEEDSEGNSRRIPDCLELTGVER